MQTPIRLTAASLIAALLALPAAAQSVTVTGNNGGTIQKSRDCLRGGGTAMCQTSATATTANGQTATRNRTRVTGDGQSTTTVSRIGANGQTGGRTRQVNR
ncbi:hypothetical protein [Pseudodonghicola sp.]|uniref:hypothetical protein n=1 Tax=Pseudodonghicola sp. TaxID=1969463 RepID=UPI003A97288B